MNEDKTEFLIISTKQTAAKITRLPLTIGGHDIEPTKTARGLGVLWDSNANMEAHINSICRAAFFQLQNIGKLRRYMNQSALETIVHAFITTRLDYCNSLLCGLPASLLDRLQRVQNTAARILTGTPRQAHITPVLESLHWLPVQKQVKFKILLLIYKTITDAAPVYLQEFITPHVSSHNLCSMDQNQVQVPFTSSSMVQSRAFSVAGPRLWNALPCAIRSACSTEQFKSKLKTHLFKITYPKS